MKKNQTYRMIHIAILTGLSVVLMFFDFPLPFFPPFLKLDASDAVIFASSVFVGPWGMLSIILLRSVLHWFLRGAELGIPIGQLATVISSIAFVFPAYFIARKTNIVKNQRLKIILGLVLGTLVMTFVMFIANYFWITPFYFALGQVPLPENYFNYLFIYIPFNLVKGFVNSVIVYVLLPYLTRAKGKF